ncbi:MAG: BACON domain-containing protein [Bacteroides sp.]|nr:BACON domain-containing protein [Bacteroides sp.]
MKKKHLIFLLLFIGAMVVTGCSSGGGEDIPEPTPKPDPKPEQSAPEITLGSEIVANGLTFSSEGGTQTVAFSTNVDWTIAQTDASGWCTPSATQGAKGSASVIFTVKANEQTEDRKTTVTIKASTASKSFTILQEKVYVLTAKADKEMIGFSGGTLTVEVETNTDFETSVSEEWIRLSKSDSKALSKKQLIFEVDANAEHKHREAEITIGNASKNLKQILVITQQAVPEDDSEKPTGNVGDMTWG